MRKEFLHVCLLVGAVPFASVTATAQQTVHALAGKVTAVYAATKTIKVKTDDGSQGLFEVLTKNDTPLNFQKSVKAMTVPAGSFTKTDDEVVVFYIGNESVRTTVALEDLGTGPLVKSLGTVVKLDKNAHVLTIQDSSGVQTSFHLDAKTIGEATEGVVSGDKLAIDKGAKVRVTAITENGADTALFIRALSL